MSPCTEKKTEQLKNCVGQQITNIIEICTKLTELEKNWSSLFSEETESIVKQTALGKCTVEADGISVIIYVASNSKVNALKFKEKFFLSAIEKHTGAKIKKIEFETGKITRASIAKEARKAFERYAPVIISEAVIEKEKKELINFTEDEHLAKVIAKTKALADKKAKRKNTFWQK